jgi:hypothetical protein
MTQLEQLLIIIEREMNSKEFMINNDGNNEATKNYWQGGLSSLIYIRHIIEKLINEEDGK